MASPAPPFRASSMSWWLSPTMAMAEGGRPVISAKLRIMLPEGFGTGTVSAAMIASKWPIAPACAMWARAETWLSLVATPSLSPMARSSERIGSSGMSGVSLPSTR